MSTRPWVDVVVMGELNPDVVVTGVPPMWFGQREDVTRPFIGTEVPRPGGAHETLQALVPTSAQAARHTLRAHGEAFAEAGVEGVWPRVAALDHVKDVLRPYADACSATTPAREMSA